MFPVSRGAVPCSRRLCSVFWFRCAELGAEHICADIVIKSTTARVSSPHSPLICQPCSDGRLRKYMQNRWIRPPSHTSPQFPSLSHTAGPPPPLPPTPFNPPTYLPTLSHPRHTHILTYLNNFSFFLCPVPEMI